MDSSSLASSASWMAGLQRGADAAHALTCWAVQAMLGTLTLLVLAAVFWRYVLQDALVWTEEAARYLMIWMGFLGAAVASREGGHIAIDTLLERLPPQVMRIVAWIISMVSIGFLLTVFWLGLVLAHRVQIQRTPSLDISMALPYLAIPIGCILIVIQMVAGILRGEVRQAPSSTDIAS